MTTTETGFFAGLDEPTRIRHATLDVHTSAPDERRSAVVFVHGGPVPPDPDPTPRDSAVFRGYGALAASMGLVGITFDHRLRADRPQEDAYPQAADDVTAALDRTRELDQVDPDRVALWCFCGGGVLAADTLRAAPSWLRTVAWTYPVLAAPPGWPGYAPRFDCVRAIADTPDLPKLLIRVRPEYPWFTDTQRAAVDAAREAGSRLDVVDLPDAPHGYDAGGYDPILYEVTEQAMSWVATALRA